MRTAATRAIAAGAVTLRPLPLADADRLRASRRPDPGELAWHEQYPLTDTLVALELLTAAHRAAGWAGGSAPDWWLCQIVVAGEVVGDAGFHGPPGPTEPREVEIGYAVVPDWRGRGVATQACRRLVERAWRDGADVVWAEADPQNLASRRVLARCGFRSVGADRFRLARPESR